MAQYEILRSLDRGGMAEVSLARLVGIEGFEKRVVLKRVLPHLSGDARLLARFIDEARVAAQLSHPHIVQIFELGEQHGQYFIAMEHVDGRNLKDAAKRLGARGERVPVAHALRVGAAVLDALHYAHTRVDNEGRPLGLVHRDVSPSNILVSFDGIVKLIDFGIARTLDGVERTQPGVVVGKAGYMSPEQLRGDRVDARADVFSCAVSLFHVVTGALPFPGVGTAAVMHAANRGERRPYQEVAGALDEELFAILSRGFAHELEARYPDALALQADLERYALAHGAPISTARLGEWMKQTFAGEDPGASAGGETETQSRLVTLGASSFTASGTAEETARHAERRPLVSVVSADAMPAGSRRPVVTILAAAAAMAAIGGGLALALVDQEAPSRPQPVVVEREGPGEGRLSDPPSDDTARDDTPPDDTPPDDSAPDDTAPDDTAPDDSAPLDKSAGAEDVVAGDQPTPRPRASTRRNDKPAERRGKTARPATLTLDSEPWSEVTSNGWRLGLTPLHAVELPPGKHVLVLRNPEAEREKRVTITLKPGETRRMRVRLDE